MEQRLSKHGGVVVGYPHPAGEVSAAFHVALIALFVHDAYTSRHLSGHIPVRSGPNIVSARNYLVNSFLEETPAEWLWSLDADMTFPFDTLDRLLQAADKDDRPIMAGLCFSYRLGEDQDVVPTLYGMNEGRLAHYNRYPEDVVAKVAGTGAACILIHRSVLERIRDARWDEAHEEAFVAEHDRPSGQLGSLLFPPPFTWYEESIIGPSLDDVISEDLTFCLRAAQVGFPTHVDTRVKVGHVKPIVVDDEMFRSRYPMDDAPGR